MSVYSSSGIAGPQRLNRCPGYGYVDNWRTIDLRNHHKLHDVFPGGARFLDLSLSMYEQRAGVASIVQLDIVCQSMELGYRNNKSDNRDLFFGNEKTPPLRVLWTRRLVLIILVCSVRDCRDPS